jgi:hypothetical protein
MGPYTQPDESSTHLPTLSNMSIILHLCLGPQVVASLHFVQPKFCMNFSLTHFTCTVYLILLDLITLIFGKEGKS